MTKQQLRRSIPWIMAGTRAALGPLVIAAQLAGWSGASLVVAVVLALLSDIFDGVLARRWSCDTAAVRLFDSMADTIFYAGTAIALWLRHPVLVRSLAWPLAIVVGLELSRIAVEVVKFGKPASYHSRLAKLWGLCLAIAAVCGFVVGNDNVLGISWLLASLVGIACDAEGLAMSLVLPVWRKDVAGLGTARQLRGVLLAERVQNQPIRPV